MSDLINHPDHYQGTNGIECLAVIEAILTPEEYAGYLKGCAIKYLFREERKGSQMQDLGKCENYFSQYRQLRSMQAEGTVLFDPEEVVFRRHEGGSK